MEEALKGLDAHPEDQVGEMLRSGRPDAGYYAARSLPGHRPIQEAYLVAAAALAAALFLLAASLLLRPNKQSKKNALNDQYSILPQKDGAAHTKNTTLDTKHFDDQDDESSWGPMSPIKQPMDELQTFGVFTPRHSFNLVAQKIKEPPRTIGSTSDPPSILNDVQLTKLRNELPTTLRPKNWRLVYSTEQHGCSLRTFFHRVDQVGPVVLVVLDSEGHKFGGFVSESWQHHSYCSGYFGTGETFLFKIHPSFKIFRWTRNNSHFVHSAADCIAFGSGRQKDRRSPEGIGHPGLFLGSDFEMGSSSLASSATSTFANEALASSPEFRCVKVECWTFTETS